MSDLRETEHARMIREQEESAMSIDPGGRRRAAQRVADASRTPCPTCDGQGGWKEDVVEADNWKDGMFHARECPDCFGYGTLDAKALLAMVLELRVANGELHDAMAGQQASHEAEMLDAARSSLVRLCRELDLPIHEDPRTGIRDAMAVFRVASNTKEAT